MSSSKTLIGKVIEAVAMCHQSSEQEDATVGGEAMTYLPVGNTTVSRRILKQCRVASLTFATEETDVRVGHHNYKKVVGYWVPKAVYDEVLAAYQPRTERECEWVCALMSVSERESVCALAWGREGERNKHKKP